MDITFIDFFSGIGGFHSGFEKAGMKCIGWCEFDKHAQKSYRALYDTKGLYFNDDVRKIRGWELPNATLWSFGFPCQDVSIAGKQKGIGRGTRSGLFFEIMRLLDEKEDDKPEWIICENVKNLLSIEGGWGFFRVTSEMAARGYTVQWRVYNSKDYGVPQNRERVYIVGCLGKNGGGELLPTARKSERALKKMIDGSQGDRVYEPELSCTLSSQGGGMGAKTGLYVVGHVGKGGQKSRVFHSCGNVGTLSATDYKDPPKVMTDNEAIHVKSILTPDRLKKIQNGRRIKEEGEPMFTLTGQDRHGVVITRKGCKFRYPERGVGKRLASGYIENTDIANALLSTHAGDYTSDGNTGVVEIKNATKSGATPAMIGDGIETAYSSSNTRRARVQPGRCSTITTHGTAGVLMDTSPVRIRKLTPKECWRLQGFTDEQFEKAAKVNSNTQLYKQAGNAVTVNVVEAIGKHIVGIIKGE